MEKSIVSVLQKLNIEKLRPHQKIVIEHYLSGRDVLLCSPTGSGKSLTFELAPFLFKDYENSTKATVIVVSPLVALMKKQTEKALSIGLKAVYLKEVSAADDILISTVEALNLDDIKNGESDIIFTSPESLLGHHRNVITELEKRQQIKAIFIDEAHCISKFGISTDKNKDPFRPTYSQLGELRSLTTVPVIALTATASAKTQTVITDKMCMDKCEKIILSPNKMNMKYWLCETSGNVTQDFDWLVSLLLNKDKDTPRMIIFFRRTRQIGDLYEYLVDMLGDSNDHGKRLFDMFHSKTHDEVKESICSSYMDYHGTMRVVLVSTSFSMGLDVKGVDTVIHYGPANDMEDYLQETGRAGRDENSQSHAILMKYKRCLSGKRSIKDCMKSYCKQSSCRRIEVLKHFDSSPLSLDPAHKCCDVCALSCRCLCHCAKECTCDSVCPKTTSEIMNCILASHDSDGLSSSEDSTREQQMSSDSDIDTSRRRIVLNYSSESD